MNDFLDILKYVIPAAIVLLACYFTMQKFMDNEQKKIAMKLRREGQKMTTPIRLQAYERIILFLERTSLDNLILRVQKKDMSARTLQALLVQTIRSEFEHNITQQVYISNNAWAIVKRTKDENIKFINNIAAKMKEGTSSNDLAMNLLKILSKAEQSPNQLAVELIKKEVRKLF